MGKIRIKIPTDVSGTGWQVQMAGKEIDVDIMKISLPPGFYEGFDHWHIKFDKHINCPFEIVGLAPLPCPLPHTSGIERVSSTDPVPAPTQATALTIFPGVKRITAEWGDQS